MGAIHFSLDPQFARFFKENLSIQTFVETGTFEGNTVETARNLFDPVYSVELSEHYFKKASERFQNTRGVTLLHGESPALLSKYRDEFQAKPVLFWLDAHWCCAEHTSGEDSQSPLIKELEAIEKLNPDSVLLIDDARLYLCPPPQPHRYSDWPDWHDITTALLRLSPTHRLMVLNDVVVFSPESIRRQLNEYAFKSGADWLVLAHLARLQQQQDEAKKKRKRRLFW